MSRPRRGPFGYEHRSAPLASPRVYRRRLLRSAVITAILIGGSLAIGVVGYRVFGGITSWLDCLYNAAMILGGMGPVSGMHTAAGKLFASAYALYSGVMLLASVGVLLAPVLHRVLHRFHLETEEDARE